MMSSNEPIIQVNDLWHVYPDGTEALRGINLEIYSGELIALIGQNGSGKTTLAKHFNGLLKPTKGSVLVNKNDVSKTPIDKLATFVGYAFQNPDHQICKETVENEVAFGPRNLGLPEEEVKKRTDQAIELLLLDHVKTEHPFFLSRALRRRLAVASVLAMEPLVIVVDEPTTGMDALGAYSIMNFLKRLNDMGKTIIIITHNMRIVAEYAKRTIVLSQGKVLLDGSTTDVFSQPEILKQAFISPPQITQLAQNVVELGFRPNIMSVKEMMENYKKVSEGAV